METPYVVFTVLVPQTVRIPLSRMIDLIDKAEDIIAAQSDKIIGTPPVYIDDLIMQAIADGVVSIPDGWELPTDSNQKLEKSDYRRKRNVRA